MDKVLLEKIAEYAIYADKENWGTNINSFDWVPGVGLYGIYKAYLATQDSKLLDYLISWIDQHLNEAYETRTVNSTCPLLTVISIYDITQNNEYLKVCKDIAEYVVTKAPITREGGLEHTVTEAVGNFSEQMWADTLFMAGLFLAKMGKYDSKYTDFAVKQLKIHLKYLFDEKDALFYHGWNCAAENHMSSVYWARANAWIIYSATEMIEILGKFDGYDLVCSYIQRHVAALRKYQRHDGGFSTVINDLSSYDEASATAGIIAGIKHAVQLGILPEKEFEMYDRGVEYLKALIADDGEVGNVSSGTPIMRDVESYKKIKRCPTLYGQGMALMALCLED